MQLFVWSHDKYLTKSTHWTPHKQNSFLLPWIWRQRVGIYLPNYMTPHSWRQRKSLSRHSELQIERQKTQFYINILRDRNKAGNVRHHIMLTLRRARVAIVAMETQKCVPFVLLTYIWHYQQCNKYRKLCMEAQSRVPCIVAIHISLPTIWNTIRSVRTLSNFLSHFNQIWSSPTDFLKSPFTTIRPLGSAMIPAETRTYGVTKLMGVFHDLRKHVSNSWP